MQSKMEEKTDPTIEATLSPPEDLEVAEIYGINGAGHVQELDRNFNLLSACGMALTAGNTWAALGGSIVNLELFRPRLVTASDTDLGRCHQQWWAAWGSIRIVSDG